MELDIQRFADGKVVIQTELDTKNFKNGLDRMQNSAKGAGASIKGIVAGLGITKLIGAAFNTIRNSMDDAISRLDTLNNFPKVMSNLGVSAKDSEKAIKKMSDKLAGLPTTLDQGASAVQRFTSKNGDVKKSTNLFLALNNAILAGGAPTEMQATALEQLSQAYAKGKPDMMEWRSAMSAMPAQLKQVAQAMGYVNADELGEALRNGTVSMDDFMDTITKLNTEGVNGFKSFEEQARNSTGGIRTSITVAKTQIVKGVADMIEGLNKGLKRDNLGSIQEIIANIGKWFKKELDKVASLLSKIDFKKLITAFKLLAPVVLAAAGALITYNLAMKGVALVSVASKVISTATAFIQLIPAIKGVKDAVNLLSMAFNANPIGVVITAIVGLIAVLGILYKKNEDFRNMVNETFGTVKKVVIDAISRIKEILMNLWKSIKPSMEQLMKSFKKLWDAIKPVVGILLKLMGLAIIGFIKGIVVAVTVLAEILKVVIPIITSILTVIIDFVTKVVSFFTQTIPNAFNSFVEGVKNLYNTVINFFKNLPENIGYMLGFVIGSIAKFLVNLGASLIKFVTTDIPNFINGIVNWFAQLPGRIWTWLTQLPSKIGQAVSNMTSTAKSKLSGFISAFVNALSTLPGKVMNIGKNIMKGLWNGISGLKDWVINKVKGMGKGIVNGLKKALGIHSPSTVMRDVIGKNIVLGIGEGFDNEIDKLYNKMQHTIDIENSKLQANVETGKVFNSLVATTPVNVNLNAGVELDGQKVGRLITPEVSRTIKSGGGV